MNYPPIRERFDRETVRNWCFDSVDKLIALVDDLEEFQLDGPYSRQLNPTLWEMTHALWFIENWTLRDLLSVDPYFEDVDHIYDSTRIRHGKRWVEEMIPLDDVKTFSEYLKSEVESALSDHYGDEKFLYRLLYGIYHADMHTEALTFQRQSRGLKPPSWFELSEDSLQGSNETSKLIDETVNVPGGRFRLGASREEFFYFDNEKWEHEVQVDPFKIDRTPVTEGQFREFVDAGGYRNPEYWSRYGEEWIKSRGLNSPVYWEKRQDRWMKRVFDRWIPLQDLKPMNHVSYYEARAYCNWAGRRLPTEAEWTFAASTEKDNSSGSTDDKRLYPWGDSFPEPTQANLDWTPPTRCSVTELPDGESAWGCRQMVGNVWEWTTTTFEPFSGFEADFYQQYSEPWFGSRKVMKGGSWCTRSRLIRNSFRNFYTPDRNDRYLGFRTCEKD